MKVEGWGWVWGESDGHVSYIKYYTLLVQKGMTTSTYRSNKRYLFSISLPPCNDIHGHAHCPEQKRWWILPIMGHWVHLTFYNLHVHFEAYSKIWPCYLILKSSVLTEDHCCRSMVTLTYLEKLVPFILVSQLCMIAIGLQKPCAKPESSANLILYDV